MKPRGGWAVTAVVSVLLAFSLRPLGKAFGKPIGWKNVSAVFTPRAGEEVLPPAVRESRHLLQQAGATEFALSSEILADTLMSQRLTEGLYPLRLQVQAPVHLAGTKEPIPKTCSLKLRGTDVQLLACPQ